MYQKKRSRYGIVDHEVITDPNISVQAKGLYSVLCCYANANRICWPSISRLADDTNSSQRSVKRWLKELKDSKIVHRVGSKLKIT